MKIKKLYPIFFVLGLFTLSACISSCSKKTGCPVNENAGVKTDKYGDYKVKKTKSGLFPKKKRG